MWRIQIKAAVFLGDILLQHFVFCKRRAQKNIKYFKNIYKYFSFGCCVGWKCRKSLLGLKKGKFILFP
jgi:hypothetical protein